MRVSGYHGQCPRQSLKKAAGVRIVSNPDVDGLHDPTRAPIDVDLVEGEGRREGAGRVGSYCRFDGVTPHSAISSLEPLV